MRTNDQPSPKKKVPDLSIEIVMVGLALIPFAVCAALAWRLFDWIAL